MRERLRPARSREHRRLGRGLASACLTALPKRSQHPNRSRPMASALVASRGWPPAQHPGEARRKQRRGTTRRLPRAFAIRHGPSSMPLLKAMPAAMFRGKSGNELCIRMRSPTQRRAPGIGGRVALGSKTDGRTRLPRSFLGTWRMATARTRICMRRPKSSCTGHSTPTRRLPVTKSLGEPSRAGRRSSTAVSTRSHSREWILCSILEPCGDANLICRISGDRQTTGASDARWHDMAWHGMAGMCRILGQNA